LITFLSGLMTVVAAVLSLFALMYCVQVLLALVPPWRKRALVRAGTDRPSLAVVIPAHDEEAGIGTILSMVRPQLDAGDRLIVVADNCTDATAEVARGFGATVLERNHATDRGKSFALDYAVRYLENEPPAMVVFFDADSMVDSDTVAELAAACAKLGRPAQAKHVMLPVEGSRVDSRVSSFGNLVKNHVRLLGMRRMGLPSHLTGSGMIFPWSIISCAELAHGHLTEDKKLGIDLTIDGYPPYYCAEAAVWTEAPYTAKGAKTQRERWESGHLSLTRLAPQIMKTAFRHNDPGLFLLAVDIALPPMVLLILGLAAAVVPALLLVVLDGWTFPLWILALSLGLVLALTLAAWWVFGRAMLPARSLPLIVPFILSKIAVYSGNLLKRPESRWIRTDRTRPGK
jgi:cellulose synthase/poly-beta-1,6-N-acetylglucosamine synthase-like glycosyltransferase